MPKKPSSKQKTSISRAEPTRWAIQWQRQYEILKRYRNKHPSKWPGATEEYPRGNRIGQWCNRQRDLFFRGELEKERLDLLKKIGFAWERTDDRDGHWNRQIENLKAYRQKNPENWPFAREEFPRGNRLGLWVWRQRQNYAKGELPKDRLSTLKKIKFPLELPDSWESQYQTLLKYRKKNPGRWPKAREEFPTGTRLGLWCHLQRCAYKAGKLLDERTEKLEKIGFIWSVKEESWRTSYEALKEYKRKNLKAWPSLSGGEPMSKKLLYWVNSQRKRKKRRKLDSGKVALLDKIGFDWQG